MKSDAMKNLKKLVKARNKSLISLAVELEVSQEAVSQYISGKIKPKTATVIKMAQILNTTTDYLLGLTANPNPSDFTLSEEENTLITNYRKLNNIEKVKLEAYLQAMVDFKSN